jgi:hypothetical protein
VTFDRESGPTDALLTDLYLDALLAGAVLDAAGGGPPTDPTGGLDPAARQAADRLRRDLVRVHPSFRFEERLATRLAEAAVAMRVAVAAGGEGGHLLAFRTDARHAPDADLIPTGPGDEPDPLLAGDRPGVSEAGLDPRSDLGARRVPGRPLLIGGALTSAALSIAGAAYVAWRFARPGRGATPMARAARAVRDARLSAALEATAAHGRPTPRRLD